MISRLIVFLVFFFTGLVSGFAEKRVALVIGNSTYQNTAALGNTINDASDVAKQLKSLGFEVIHRANMQKGEMDRVLGDFNRLAQKADAALFYYAGHGMQFQGTNYLMPIDARLEDEVSLRYEMIHFDVVRTAMQEARVKLIVLDACRNNPLAERLSRSITSTTRAADPTRGLAPPALVGGTLVAYATQANEIALDGSERNSPFTAAFLKEVKEPGVEVNDLFSRIRQEVYRTTKSKQLPELSVSLISNFYLNNGESAQQAWSRIRLSEDPRDFEAFIATYASSFLIQDARERQQALEHLKRERDDKIRLNEQMKKDREQLDALRQAVEREREAAEKAAHELKARQEAALQQQQASLREQELRLRKELEQRESEIKAKAAALEAMVDRHQKDVSERENQINALRSRVEAEKTNADLALRERETALRKSIEQEFASRSAAEREAALNERMRQLNEEFSRRERSNQDALKAEITQREAALKDAAMKSTALNEEVERLKREKAEADRKAATLVALPSPSSSDILPATPPVAMVTLPSPAPAPALAQTATPIISETTVRAVKTELRRLGCYSGTIDGAAESTASRRALEAYAKQSSVDLASIKYNEDFLKSLQDKKDRVCPLECAKGQRESEGKCVAIECPKGQVLGSDGSCVEKPARKLAASPAQKQQARPSANGRGRCFTFGGRNFCE